MDLSLPRVCIHISAALQQLLYSYDYPINIWVQYLPSAT